MSLSNYLKIVNPTEPCTDMPQTLAYEYKFPLDPFQQHAISANTGSGKTL